MQRSKIQKAHRNVCLFVVVVFFFFFYGILILIQIEKPLANTLPNRNKPRKQRNHNLIKTKGGATLPLGGGGRRGPCKKEKKSTSIYTNINWAPQWCTFGPLPISVQYLNSLPGSSFNCRPFYPLIKQNTAHSPLIFKYSKYYPTKQHFIIHSPTQNQKIQNPFFCFSFYSLLVYYVHATAHSTGYSSPQKRKKKKKPSAQLSPPLKLSPHDPQKKKNLTIIFFVLAFLK